MYETMHAKVSPVPSTYMARNAWQPSSSSLLKKKMPSLREAGGSTFKYVPVGTEKLLPGH